MNFEALTLDRRDGVATITLNRPDAFNALNLQLGRDLFHAALEVDDTCDAHGNVPIRTGHRHLRCRPADAPLLPRFDLVPPERKPTRLVHLLHPHGSILLVPPLLHVGADDEDAGMLGDPADVRLSVVVAGRDQPAVDDSPTPGI